MLPLGLFARRNFAVGNLQTFAMYGGLSATFFFLVLFLQQVAGYDALEAGFALMPATLVMFALSKRIGRLADRVGPRLFMGFGPLTAALGLGLMLRIDADLDYFTDLLPALLIFSLGLALTVAPLTATVLADAEESNAGIASGVNNAIARVAGLLAVAAIGAVVSAQFGSALDDRLDGRTLSPAEVACRRERARRDARPRRSRAGGRAGRGGRGVRVESRLPRRHRHLDRRSWRSAACSGWPGSATRAGRCAARTARAASSRASPSTRRASAPSGCPSRRPPGRSSPDRLQTVTTWSRGGASAWPKMEG